MLLVHFRIATLMIVFHKFMNFCIAIHSDFDSKIMLLVQFRMATLMVVFHLVMNLCFRKQLRLRFYDFLSYCSSKSGNATPNLIQHFLTIQPSVISSMLHDKHLAKQCHRPNNQHHYAAKTLTKLEFVPTFKVKDYVRSHDQSLYCDAGAAERL